MSGNKQFVIDINRSRQLFSLLFFMHGLAVVSLILLSWPFYLNVIALMLIAFSLIFYLKKSHEVVRIVAQPENQWLIQKADGSTYSASIAGNTYISDWLTLLVFLPSGKKSATYVCLMKDSVADSSLSQLKLNIKLLD